MLEEAVAQQSARQAELNDARARLAEAEYRLDRTHIRSPADAIVERRLISVGDFVSPGTPIVTIVAWSKCGSCCRSRNACRGSSGPGCRSRWSSRRGPATPSRARSARCGRWSVPTSRGRGTGGAAAGTDWPPGGSVTAHVVLAARDGVVVPAASVVRRPAGDVVYALQGDKVAERQVTIGIRTSERAEVLSGIAAGETVVLSGAGFLTDGALVSIREPAGTAPTP